MPIYEYECQQCNANFDVVVMRASEKFTPTCDRCGSTEVRKLVSRVRISSEPTESGLADRAANRMMQSFGGNVSDGAKREINQMAKVAAARGKRRFEHMKDTGKAENIEY